MEKSSEISESVKTPTLPKWWRVIPSIVLLVMISTADTLIINDFIEYRYAVQYQVNSSTTSNVHELCLNATHSSHNSNPIVSTTTSKNPISTTMSPADRVQSATASLNVYISLVSTIPAILTSILLGTNCDRIGRKALIVLPFFGKVFRYVILTAVAYYSLSDVWIVISIMVDSVFGTSGLSLLSSFAYVSDCTSAEKRTTAIIIMDVCIVASRVIPLFGMGVYLEEPRFTQAMVFTLFVSLAGLIFSIVLQPESNLIVQHLNIVQQLTRIKCGEIIKMFRVFFVKRQGNKQRSLLMLIGAHLSMIVMAYGIAAINYLYLYGPPFCLDAFGVSLTTAAQTVCMVIYTIIVTLTIPKGKDHLSMPIIGCFAYIIYAILFGVASHIWMIYVAVFFGALFTVLLPVIRSSVYKLVEQNEYASVFILASIFESGGSYAFSAMANEIYKSTLTVYSGIVYFVFALFGVLGIGILLILSILKYRTLVAQRTILLNE